MGTPRVSIVQLPAEALTALAEGDQRRAETASPVPLSSWLASPDNTWTWAYRARQVVEHPEDLPWVTAVVWDLDTERAVGRAGFHAAPDAHGLVEVGYAIDPRRRRRGYARAALEVLLARADREPAVRVIRASVAPANVASRSLITQYPFVEVGEQWDDEDGLEVVWELTL